MSEAHVVCSTIQSSLPLIEISEENGAFFLVLRTDDGGTAKFQCHADSVEYFRKFVGQRVGVTVQLLSEPDICRRQHCNEPAGKHL